MFRECIEDGSGFAAALRQFGAPIVVLLAYVAVWLSLTALWGQTPVTEAFHTRRCGRFSQSRWAFKACGCIRIRRRRR